MRIKEVENRVGMTRANIRYYEKEGLLKTTIRTENNYREYTEEDIEQLLKIKILRMLGVALADIKLLNSDAILMEEIMLKRMKELEREAKEIKDIHKICETIVDKQIDVHSLNENVLAGDQDAWKQRMEELLNRDIVKEVITKKQVNKTIAGMLSWGYLISTVVTMVMYFVERMSGGSTVFFEDEAGFYAVCMMGAVLIFLLFATYFTANIFAHIITFHISAILLSPVVIGLVRYISGTRKGKNLLGVESLIQFAVLWLILVLYIILLYILSEKWKKMFSKMRYTLIVSVGFSIVFAAIMWLVFEHCIVIIGLLVYYTLFIGLKWAEAVKDRRTYNRYYAVRHAACMINAIGLNILSVGYNNKS